MNKPTNSTPTPANTKQVLEGKDTSKANAAKTINHPASISRNPASLTHQPLSGARVRRGRTLRHLKYHSETKGPKRPNATHLGLSNEIANAKVKE